MNRRRRLLQRLIRTPANVKFVEFVDLVEGFGFRLERIRGSHHTYRHSSGAKLQLQPRKGEVKTYQVRQFLQAIARYNLRLEDDP